MNRPRLRPELILVILLATLWLVAGMIGLKAPAESLAEGIVFWVFETVTGFFRSAPLAVRAITVLLIAAVVAGLLVARKRRQPSSEVLDRIDLAKRLTLVRNLIADRVYFGARLHLEEILEEYPDSLEAWELKLHLHELMAEPDLAAAADMQIERIKASP
jgi:hypothetical protein